ncbi:glycerol-3-phosphate dehydrogenase/oxidase [Planctomicrobium sp. SH664]|uniref:glycerol-3-phosphate dehydrogenase/oxidase n=1 Tax=Planctomicrobium sp. SH664 TaxID=3448125 RepID=UPI003F5B3615
MLDRDRSLNELPGTVWDVIVIGGGATGLGTALDAVTRGYKTLLLESKDFAQGTSSRSTKLIHGGVRYLKQGNVSLVRESLHERGLLLRNAPGLVRPLEFIIPTRSFFETGFYAVGLKAYDLLAGKLGVERSRSLSLAEVRNRIPTIQTTSLYGGVSYFDAQFDDARLAVAIAQAAADHGATILNQFPVIGLLKRQGKVAGVAARDSETGREFELPARAVINATGVFTDAIRQLDEPQHSSTLLPSQGVHIVLDREFLPGNAAIIVPKTDDGRVLFVIPWHGYALVGTTDTPVNGTLSEPRARADEIDYLLTYAGKYLNRIPERRDIRSVFVGVRPLVKAADTTVTSKLSRDHVVGVSRSGLVNVTGGKWTTYRRMAADTVAAAIGAGELPARPCVTDTLRLIPDNVQSAPASPVVVSDEFVVQAVREEMARQVEDVLARRARLLFVDAPAALSAAPRVARVMARELGRDDSWINQQLEQFEAVGRQYLIDSQAS